ncbi:hypothetical protein [uncultured Paludibaculum sp.]|uniref:hypothetical protein n=1 Tax=uncultured Paludibaculum sp. TaxID=1765020 RepID=UPI002AAA7C3E|nr:hypothetical protein [uncultured Paludibaculum sp.]
MYRFVGNAPCDIGGTRYERFGSRAEFTRELAEDVLTGGGCFIPEPDFRTIGVTDAEVQMFGYAGGFPEPTPEFVHKKQRAQARAIQLMNDLSLLDAFNVDSQEAGE